MRRWSAILLLLFAGGGLAYFYMAGLQLSPGAPVAPRPAIPVITAEVLRTDVPILLTGLGTVQALNSVLIKSRVDGQIKKINFVEGQDVRAGDVLVEIDPEPYQAALNQAQANKLRDEAMLENARLDLTRFTRLATTSNSHPRREPMRWCDSWPASLASALRPRTCWCTRYCRGTYEIEGLSHVMPV